MRMYNLLILFALNYILDITIVLYSTGRDIMNFMGEISNRYINLVCILYT